MARHLTVRASAAIVLLACAIVALAYLPPRGVRGHGWRPFFVARPPTETAARVKARALAEEWRAAMASVRLAETRDYAAAARSAPVLLVRGSDSAAADLQPLLESGLDSVWADLGLGETKVRVAVLIDGITLGAADPRFPRPSTATISYLLPDPRDRTLCVVRVPVLLHPRWRERMRHAREWVKGVLGPCAFFAAYGAPGRPVWGWLGRRDFDLVELPAWDAPMPEPGGFALQMRNTAWWWDYVYSQSPDGVACLAGRAAGCRQAVLWGAGAAFPSDSLPHVVTLDRRPWRMPRRLMGSARYLADVARDIGSERFGEFWRSSLPVDTALASALREPVGRWTARWQLGIADRALLGPGPGVSHWVFAALTTVGAVVLVSWAAARRQAR